MSLKILIADDHVVVLIGTKIIIQSEIPDASVETVKNYTELLETFKENHFDILILDINMPGTQNMAMISELKSINKDTKIIVFSSYDEKVALRYIKAGADGYVNKTSDDNEILLAIESVIKKGFYYSVELLNLGMEQLVKGVDAKERDPKTQLSKKEFIVFEMLLEGFGNLEIANKLKLHMSTVSTYKKRILQKLNGSNTTELIKMYYLNK